MKQNSHSYGFSPVCTFKCNFMFLIFIKGLLQFSWLHLNGLSFVGVCCSVWVCRFTLCIAKWLFVCFSRLCIIKFALVSNLFGHSLHQNIRLKPWEVQCSNCNKIKRKLSQNYIIIEKIKKILPALTSFLTSLDTFHIKRDLPLCLQQLVTNKHVFFLPDSSDSHFHPGHWKWNILVY